MPYDSKHSIAEILELAKDSAMKDYNSEALYNHPLYNVENKASNPTLDNPIFDGATQNILNFNFSDAINKWVMFSYNYNIGSDGKPTFFEAFGGSLRNHLYTKWSGYYKTEGSGGVMNRFWAELSSNNQEVLADWINNNYNL